MSIKHNSRKIISSYRIFDCAYSVVSKKTSHFGHANNPLICSRFTVIIAVRITRPLGDYWACKLWNISECNIIQPPRTKAVQSKYHCNFVF